MTDIAAADAGTATGAAATIPIFSTTAEMSSWSDKVRGRGQRIAFVPTMGALHAGHAALLDEGRRRGDCLALSI